MIKLIATDIDGTLLDKDRFISTRTATIFKQLEIPKVLISARMPQAMHYLQDALDISGTPIICYNGALVLDNDQVLHTESIDYEVIKQIAAIGLENDLHVSLYRNDEWFVEQMDQWAAREVNNTRTQPQIQSLAKSLAYLENSKDQGGAHKIMFMGDADKMDLGYQWS